VARGVACRHLSFVHVQQQRAFIHPHASDPHGIGEDGSQAAVRQATYDGRAAGNYLMVVREVLPSTTTCLRTNVDATCVTLSPGSPQLHPDRHGSFPAGSPLSRRECRPEWG